MQGEINIIQIVLYSILIAGVAYLIISNIVEIPIERLRNNITKKTAYMIATKNLSKQELYDVNGRLLPSIKNKIKYHTENLRCLWDSENYYIINYIWERKLLNEQYRTKKFHTYKIAAALMDYVEFGRAAEIQKQLAYTQVQGMTPEQAMSIKKTLREDYVGVYIIYNIDRNMYYVGQAKKLYFRVCQHFTGHGNGDVYADYKYGNRFVIRMILLVDSGYSDLDLLERDKIREYNAYTTGYNKTVGNGYQRQPRYTGSNPIVQNTGNFSYGSYGSESHQYDA